MKAELAVSREQLRNYELMEKEIDDAVMGLGRYFKNMDFFYLIISLIIFLILTYFLFVSAILS